MLHARSEVCTLSCLSDAANSMVVFISLSSADCLVLSRLPGCDGRLQHTQVVTHKEISMMSTLVATCTNR